tara:strand:+ start:3387 stop:3548 length:162 start_codon:yes stop_codon:yes gene_type:complete
MVELLLPKQVTRVRFPSPAPNFPEFTGFVVPDAGRKLAIKRFQGCAEKALNRW